MEESGILVVFGVAMIGTAFFPLFYQYDASYLPNRPESILLHSVDDQGLSLVWF
jgi:hypothetical protein